MKISMKLAAVAALLAAAVPAFAQIKINDNLSVTGWSVFTNQYNDFQTANSKVTPNVSTDTFNVDAALLGATITPTKDVSATFSMYYKPEVEGGANAAGDEVTLLDAYVAWTPTSTITLTAGKYLSPLGYESFYPISDNMITLANQQFLAPIPGYHDGVKVDYAPDKTTTMGIGLVDSLYGPSATQGDGELKHNFGTEGYLQYTGIENLTLWFGAGLDSKGDLELHDVWVLDFWASYQIDKASSVAVEEIYKDGGDVNFNATTNPLYVMPSDKGSNWLFYYNYNFTDKFSAWFGFSGEDVTSGMIGTVETSGPRYWKLSLSPAYAITANLSLKAQYSYTKYSNFAYKDDNFLGAEVAFKF